jgi:hypothetical protein
MFLCILQEEDREVTSNRAGVVPPCFQAKDNRITNPILHSNPGLVVRSETEVCEVFDGDYGDGRTAD